MLVWIQPSAMLAGMRVREKSPSYATVQPPQLYRTAERACGYFPERLSNDLVVDPNDAHLAWHYPGALAFGFRRSGDLLYRPHCRACQACVAVRIDIARFIPSRSQRRNLTQNADLDVRIGAPQRRDEHLALYQRYLRARHAGGGMEHHGAAEFDQFLTGAWSDTRFLEVRKASSGQLIALAVTDIVADGMSAVYTCYDPGQAKRGLGMFCILQQIQWARRLQLAHLYLGYWIDGHAKMHYKRGFNALEGFIAHQWQPLARLD